MSIDPSKWLEVVKGAIDTAAIYKLALAAVCVIYWIAARAAWVPSAEPWEFRLAAFGFLFFFSLWLANVVTALFSIFQPRAWFVHSITIFRQKGEVKRYIPHMGLKERKIIAYLLAKNQKSFAAARDGGHAKLLISRSIVVPALAPGQISCDDSVPMIIPDHIWGVLEKHKDQFPYTSPPADETEPHPWRIHWMER